MQIVQFYAKKTDIIVWVIAQPFLSNFNYFILLHLEMKILPHATQRQLENLYAKKKFKYRNTE